MSPHRPAWLAFALILMLGCGNEPDDEITGTYALVGVEGEALPYLERSDAECDEFISEGELVLLPGRTYTLEFSGPYDCSRGGGQTGTLGRFYNGTFTQAGTNTIAYDAELHTGETLHFTGTANPLEAFVTVPPFPPQTGPDLTLQFAIVP